MTHNSAVCVLVIDDNVGSLELLQNALAQPGVEILTASDPEHGLELVVSRHPQIVLTDLMMPGMNGLEVLSHIMAIDPSIDVVLMTAHYSTETAVEAIKKGASDYLNKPVSIALIRDKIGKLIEAARQRRQVSRLQDEVLANAEFEGIIGNSPLMWDMFSRIRRVAPHYRSILITGGTGTGKDLIAHALHRLSPVSRGRLVVLNCSAVVETLFESELFGHVRGSFTGATADKPGLVEQAHGGTLFLDEIGDMPPATQAKMLRVLQNQEVQRVGSLTPRKIDIRVVAATHRDLRSAIQEKGFREDLYYRLSMVEIQVPHLADRQGDLPLLTRHFISKFATQYAKEIRGITRRAEIQMAAHCWPGNVRELENVIGHAAMMTMSDMIDVQDLPSYLSQKREQPYPAASLKESEGLGALEENERLLVVRALEEADGNQSKAARQLRIGRDALRYKMKKYGLEDIAS
jgi:DNA-binding NtrC family response regulator